MKFTVLIAAFACVASLNAVFFLDSSVLPLALEGGKSVGGNNCAMEMGKALMCADTLMEEIKAQEWTRVPTTAAELVQDIVGVVKCLHNGVTFTDVYNMIVGKGCPYLKCIHKHLHRAKPHVKKYLCALKRGKTDEAKRALARAIKHLEAATECKKSKLF